MKDIRAYKIHACLKMNEYDYNGNTSKVNKSDLVLLEHLSDSDEFLSVVYHKCIDRFKLDSSEIDRVNFIEIPLSQVKLSELSVEDFIFLQTNICGGTK